MKTRAAFAFLLAGILGSSAGPVSTATAQGPICEAATDAAIDQTFGAILEAGGISENQQMVGQGVFDAWKEYLTSPSEEKLNNTALSLTKSALAALVPGAGVSIQFSEGSIAGVKATIDEAERLRMQNFMCGGSDVFDLPNNNFWEFPLVRRMGLTCENFGEQAISHDQLMQLKALWEGEHSRRVYALQGGNTLEVRNRLGQAWYVLQQQWAARWAESEYRRIRSELFRHAAGTGGSCAAPAQVAGRCGLGQSWSEVESGNWLSIWTRRGESDIFDAAYYGPSGQRESTVNQVTLSGTSVSVRRLQSSDGNLCSYSGTLQPDGERVTGSYTCGTGVWSASIQC